MLFAGLRFIFFLMFFLFGNSLFAPPSSEWRGDYSGLGPRPSIVARPEPKPWHQSFLDFFGWSRPIERPVFGPTEPEILTAVRNSVFGEWDVYGFELPRDNSGRVHSFVSIDARKHKDYDSSCHLYGSWINKPQISGKGFRRVGVVSHIKVIYGQVTVRSVDSDRKRNPIDRITPVTLRAGEFRSLTDILSGSNFSQPSTRHVSSQEGRGAPCQCRGVYNHYGNLVLRPDATPSFLEPCSVNCLKYRACPNGHFGRDPKSINKCRVCDFWFNDVIDSGHKSRRKINVEPVSTSPILAKPLRSTKRTQIKHELPKPRMERQAFMPNPNAPAIRAQMTNQAVARRENQPTQIRRPSQIRIGQPTEIQRRSASQPQQPQSQQNEDFFDWSSRKINSGVDAVIDFFLP